MEDKVKDFISKMHFSNSVINEKVNFFIKLGWFIQNNTMLLMYTMFSEFKVTVRMNDKCPLRSMHLHRVFLSWES